MDDGPLLIADVPWLLYRAFFSLPKSIKGADGRPVNALLGTVNALLAASEAQPPRAVVACFGAEEARYRVEAYPPYHAHRDADARRSCASSGGARPRCSQASAGRSPTPRSWRPTTRWARSRGSRRKREGVHCC